MMWDSNLPWIVPRECVDNFRKTDIHVRRYELAVVGVTGRNECPSYGSSC